MRAKILRRNERVGQAAKIPTQAKTGLEWGTRLPHIQSYGEVMRSYSQQILNT